MASTGTFRRILGDDIARRGLVIMTLLLHSAGLILGSSIALLIARNGHSVAARFRAVFLDKVFGRWRHQSNSDFPFLLNFHIGDSSTTSRLSMLPRHVNRRMSGRREAYRACAAFLYCYKP